MDSLPEDINMNQLLMNHLTEIETLRKACDVKRKCAVFQSIPREMRRRAASNNPKRRPKSIQWGNLSAKKKPNVKRFRKSRLKTKSRMAMHTPLHMWFTKRFVLSEKWGKLLPEHNNLKNRRLLFRTLSSGFSVFFLPHLKTFNVSLSQGEASEKQLFEAFSRHCLEEDIKKLEKLSSMQEITIHFYDSEKHLIGPCRLMFVKTKECPNLIENCLITSHIEVYEKISDIFNGIVEHTDLCHIRLIGPNSQKALNNRLFKRQHKFPENDHYDIVSLQEDEVAYQDLNIKKLLENNNKNVLLLLNYSSKCDISTVNLMVAAQHIRIVWNSIVDNCNIHVGGWRDLKDLSLNLSLPVFPEIGYYDALVRNGEKVARTEQELRSHDSDWVYVTLEYEFGSWEEKQQLFLLNENSLKKVNNHICNKDVRLRQITMEKLNDTSIGHVEFGGYSMKKGKSIAIGRLKINDWKQLVEKKNNEINNDNFVLAENLCKQLYLVRLSILYPIIDNPFNL